MCNVGIYSITWLAQNIWQISHCAQNCSQTVRITDLDKIIERLVFGHLEQVKHFEEYFLDYYRLSTDDFYNKYYQIIDHFGDINFTQNDFNTTFNYLLAAYNSSLCTNLTEFEFRNSTIKQEWIKFHEQ